MTNGIQIQRLDRKQFHTLTKWVAANVANGRAVTLAMLAREASAALAFNVAECSVRDALELEAIKLAEPANRKQSAGGDRLAVVAGELVRIMEAFGDPTLVPSQPLRAIAERRGLPLLNA